ncbi:MAG: hypothetical protein ABEJ22_04690 [Haloferacaceae archaeon]
MPTIEVDDETLGRLEEYVYPDASPEYELPESYSDFVEEFLPSFIASDLRMEPAIPERSPGGGASDADGPRGELEDAQTDLNFVWERSDKMEKFLEAGFDPEDAGNEIELSEVALERLDAAVESEHTEFDTYSGVLTYLCWSPIEDEIAEMDDDELEEMVLSEFDEEELEPLESTATEGVSLDGDDPE